MPCLFTSRTTPGSVAAAQQSQSSRHACGEHGGERTRSKRAYASIERARAALWGRPKLHKVSKLRTLRECDERVPNSVNLWLWRCADRLRQSTKKFLGKRDQETTGTRHTPYTVHSRPAQAGAPRASDVRAESETRSERARHVRDRASRLSSASLCPVGACSRCR